MEGLIQSIQEIEFSTIEELYERKEEIREKFKLLDKNTQRIYKWYYFYQLCCVDYDFKSAMWDYMYEITGAELRLAHQYRLFKNKKEKYHQKYMLEEEKKSEQL